MSANPDEQHQRQIQARIDACQGELSNLEAEQQRLAGRYSTLKARIEALREDLQPSRCQAEPFDQWSADAALGEKHGVGRDRDPLHPPSDIADQQARREVDGPGPDQPLPRGGIVLNGEDTGSLLLEAILTLREIANLEQGGVNGRSWCRNRARAMLDRIQSVGEARP